MATRMQVCRAAPLNSIGPLKVKVGEFGSQILTWSSVPEQKSMAEAVNGGGLVAAHMSNVSVIGGLESPLDYLYI